jgi:putative tricarboxylic transport membrane protein
MTFFHLHRKRVLGLITPILIIVAAIVLLTFITENPEQADAMARGIAGPITWPRVMLYGVIFFSALWLLLDLRHVHYDYREHRDNPEARTIVSAPTNPVTNPEQAGDLKIWIGLAIIIAYGFLIPVLGFTIATLIYIVIWLLLGGIRKPVLITLVSLIGTVVMLYVFVKLALMPLDRGEGVFGEITLSIYRFLKLF